MIRRQAGVALAIVVSGLIAGCGGAEVEAEGSVPELITALAGPQGRVPQFVVECAFSHASFDDPIVHPGNSGASHLHHFFGNHSTDATSTYDSLIAADTTCNDQQDTAAYWVPALLSEGKEVEPVQAVGYYRPGLNVDPTTIEPYPAGLEMVSGETAWSCGTALRRWSTPPECPAQSPLHLLIVFPDCWNDLDLRSADHLAHVAFSTNGQCGERHPTPIPQLTLTIEYPSALPADGLSLSSGDVSTAHADFINSWDQSKLAGDVGLCLARNVVCGVSG